VDATGATQQVNPVSLSAAATGNFVINGGFDIAQRGTSGLNPNVYTLDRWYSTWANAQQVSIALYGSNSRYAILGSNSSLAYDQLSPAGTTVGEFVQPIETLNVSALWNRTVTLSAWVANFPYGVTFLSTRLPATVTMSLYYSTSTDAAPTVYTGGSATLIASSSIDPNSGTAQFLTVTATVPATARTLFVVFTTKAPAIPDPLAAQVAPFYYATQVREVQLELGITPTPFRRAGGTIAGELAACQRYYSLVQGSSPTVAAAAIGATTQYALGLVTFPVTMRIAPTVVLYSYAGTANKVSPFSTADVGTVVTARNVTQNTIIRLEDSGLGFTAGQAYWFSYTADAEL
jgi:hypothetical protein